MKKSLTKKTKAAATIAFTLAATFGCVIGSSAAFPGIAAADGCDVPEACGYPVNRDYEPPTPVGIFDDGVASVTFCELAKWIPTRIRCIP